MNDVSMHFSRHEFACKCGCGLDTVDVELVELLEALRAHLGRPLIVTSGCRCPTYNAKVGGGRRSQHLFGRAADVLVDDPLDAYRWLCKQYPDAYGFGAYPDQGFVHIDSRTNGPARWVS